MATYSNDFSGYTAGGAPSGWTDRWSSSWTTLVQDDRADCYGDQYLALDASADAWKLLSWDTIDTDPNRNNVEILARFRLGAIAQNDKQICLIGRGSGSGSTENAYLLTVNGNTFEIGKLVSGSYTTLDSLATGLIGEWDDRWYWLRIRVNGSAIQARYWDDRKEEPWEWLIEATDTSITGNGWVGLGQWDGFSGLYSMVDTVSVGTNGDSAPFPGSDTNSNLNLGQALIQLGADEGVGELRLGQQLLNLAADEGVGELRIGQMMIQVAYIEPRCYLDDTVNRRVFGYLEYPTGHPIGNATLRFRAIRNRYDANIAPYCGQFVPRHSSSDWYSDQTGLFSADIDYGQYRVYLQEQDAEEWLILGRCAIEPGGAIGLGELLEFTETTISQSTADIASQTWVEASYSAGNPSTLAITGLDPGRASPGSYIRVNRARTAIIGDFERAFQYYQAQMASHRQHRILA